MTIEQLTSDEAAEFGFAVVHVGINCADADEAHQVTQTFCNLFGFPYRAGEGSDFAGPGIEVLKSPFLGKLGHIAVATDNMEKAVAYLKGKGVTFNESSTNYFEDGSMRTIYLEQEVGGFAVHLVKR